MVGVGLAAAYGRRRRPAFVARRAVNRGLRALAAPVARETADHLQFWPPPRDPRQLADLAARITWYLPRLAVPVSIAGGDRFALDASAAPYLDPALVRADTWTSRSAGERPLHVLHDVRTEALLRAGARMRRSVVADPRLSYTSEFMGYRRLRDAFYDGGDPAASDPGDRLRELLSRRVPGGRALVLGTGPSAAELDPAGVDADVRIVCNSAVRNEDLIRKLQPTAIVFADPVFHFGPSRYAAAFRQDLARALDECDAVVVVPDHFAPLLVEHCPAVAGRLAAVAVGGPWNIPTADVPRVRDTGNILTLLMLPLAMALADSIDVAGCDGRQPTENYFWKHSPVTQYSDELMQTVFEAHPSFFRHRSYEDYYDRHCVQLEELVTIAEGRGQSVRGVTPSWIPALSRRGAPQPG